MGTDQHGNSMSGSDEAVESYDQAVDHLLHFRPGIGELVDELGRVFPDVRRILNDLARSNCASPGG